MASFRKRGSSWTVEVRRKGVYRVRTFRTKAAGEEWARQIEREIDTGQLAKRSTATLEDAFDKFAEEVSPGRDGARWEKIRLKRLKNDPLALVRFKDLTPEHLAEWRDRRLQEVKPSSVNRELNLISAVITRARKEWGWTDHNPISDIERPQNPQHRYVRWPQREIDRMCFALDFDGQTVTRTSHRVAVAFLLAIETGMRQGEIAKLRPADLFLDGRYVVVRKSKNKESRSVPLTQEAARLLRLLPESDTGYVLGVDSSNVSSTFRQARKDCGIEGLTFHDTRHEACTRLARKLPNVLDLARVIGHKDPRNLLIYYNPTATEIAERLDAESS